MLGTTLGALFGNHLPFNTQGIDFALSALFLVLFLEQLVNKKQYLAILIGGLGALGALLLLGPDHFMVPTMIVILICLSIDYFYQTHKELNQ